MNKLLSIVMVGIMALSSCTLSARQNTKQTYTISEKYTSLEVHNNIDVNYTVGATAPAQVEFKNGADPAKFTFEVKSGTLVMSYTGTGSVKVSLSGPAVSGIAAENNAEVKCEQMMSVSGDIRIAASNNAEVELAGASCQNLHIAAANNAEVEINRVLAANQVEVASANNAEVEIGHTDCVKLQAAVANNGEFSASWLNSTSTSLSAANNAKIEVKGKCPAADFAASSNSNIEVDELAVNHATALATELSTIHCHVGQLTISKQDPHAVIRNK